MDKTPIAVLTADFHLADRKWKNRYSLRADSYWSLYQIAAYVYQSHLPLFVAGDIFDRSTFTPDVLLRTQEAFMLGAVGNGTQSSQSDQEAAHVFYIQGNHDLQREPWLSVLGSDRSLAQFFHVGLKPAGYVATNGTHILCSGIDFTSKHKLQSDLDQLESMINAQLSDGTKNVLMLHQRFEKFMGNLGYELEDGMVPDCIDFILLGDYHEYIKSTVKSKSGKEIPLLSPGSICLQSIAEDPAKYFHVLYLLPDGTFSTEEVKLLTRKMYVVNVSTEDEMLNALAQIEDLASATQDRPEGSWPDLKLDYPVIRITYNATVVKDVLARALSSAKDRVHVFLDPVTENSDDIKRTTKVLEEVCEDPAHSLSLLLPDFVNKDTDPELFEFVSDLLHSSQPDLTVYDWEQKLINNSVESYGA